MAFERQGLGKLRIAAGALPLALALSRATACAGHPEISQRGANDAALLDTYVASDAPADAAPDALLDTGVDAPPDAALSPVLVGVDPGLELGDGSQVDSTLAQVAALGLGSRAGSLVLPYDTLIDDTGSAIAPAFANLAATCARYAQRHAQGHAALALTLALVDGTRDARPSALKASWTSAAATSALETLIDRTFDACGALAYLGIGHETERFLAQASPADRSGFVALANHALGYARGHAARPAELKVAVGFSLSGLLAAPTSEASALLAASDVALASALPLDASFHALEPQAAVDAIASLPAALAADGSIRPIALAAVSYPSSSNAGSSAEAQRAFYQALFVMLAAEREQFPFVAIGGLYDREPAACAADSALYGAPSDVSLGAALCSLGLEERVSADGGAGAGDGGSGAFATKPAFSAVLAGIAALSSP